MFFMTYADKLKKHWTLQGRSQADLMRIVEDVSRTTVSDWFSGKVRPDIENGLKVARALGVSLDYLADDGVDELPMPTDRQRQIRDLITTLGEEEAHRRLLALGGESGRFYEQGKSAPAGEARGVRGTG